MHQADLFSVPPPSEDPPRVPSAPSGSPIARDCQREGRERAKSTRSALHQRMRELYQHHGFTDDRMAEQLSAYFHRRIQRSTVNARRNEMPDVVEVGKRKNYETGVNNTVWGIKPGTK